MSDYRKKPQVQELSAFVIYAFLLSPAVTTDLSLTWAGGGREEESGGFSKARNLHSHRRVSGRSGSRIGSADEIGSRWTDKCSTAR